MMSQDVFENLANNLSEQKSFSFDVIKVPFEKITFNKRQYLPNDFKKDIPGGCKGSFVKFYKHDNEFQLAVKFIPLTFYLRAQRELLTNLKLIDYPSDYILPIIHASKNNFYFVLISIAKFIDLFDHIKYNKVFKIKSCYQNIKHLIYCLSKALFYLQSLNLAHNDIKIENIVLDEHLKQFFLIDFDQTNNIYETNKAEGTSGILSLQRLENDKISSISNDIWSVSVVVYEYLTTCKSLWSFKKDFTLKTQKRAVKNLKHATKDWERKDRKNLINIFLRMNEYEYEKRITLDELLQMVS